MMDREIVNSGLLLHRNPYSRSDVYYIAVVRLALRLETYLVDKFASDEEKYISFLEGRVRQFFKDPFRGLSNQRNAFHRVALIVDESMESITRAIMSETEGADELCDVIVCENSNAFHRELTTYLEEISRDYQFLSISRMDSDDYLSFLYTNLLDWVYTNLKPEVGSVVDFPVGSVLNTTTQEARLFLGAALFFTTFTDRNRVFTPYDMSHKNFLGHEQYFPVYTDRPFWSYIMHESNIGMFREDRYMLVDRKSLRAHVGI